MATITGITSASDKIGNPITVGVTAATLTGEISFHNVKATVTCNLMSHDGQTTLASGSYEMSTPATNGEELVIDVSSAFRSVADQYEYDAATLSFPYVTGNIVVYDEYMRDGEVIQTSTVSLDLGTYYLGAYSDMERFIAGSFKNTVSAGTYYTRKPASIPEVMQQGETYVYPSGPNTSIESSLVSAGMKTINGHKVYVLPSPSTITDENNVSFTPDSNRYVFRFVNGLGCIETISVRSLPKVNVAIESNQYLRALQQTFGSPSRSIYVKQNNRETWQFSTGPLSEEWIDWYAHEFLTAAYVWIYLGSRWLPVHVVPEDTTSIIDRTSGKMLELIFNIQFDFDGSPLTALAI